MYYLLYLYFIIQILIIFNLYKFKNEKIFNFLKVNKLCL